MNRPFATLFLAILFFVYSCTSIESPEPILHVDDLELTFTARWETQETKTVLQNDKSVLWYPGDAISMFYGNGDGGGARFESTNTEQTAVTDFHGTLTGNASGSDYYWGVYPYSGDNACDGSSVTLRVLESQQAVEGTFANGMFPAVACSRNRDLSFYNVCGGVRFSLSRTDITSVTLRANGGVAIAGTAQVKFGSDGKPTIAKILDGKSAITIAAQDGEALRPGVSYYMVMLPTDLSMGITMTFITKGGEIGSFSSTRTQIVARSTFGGLPNVDSHVTNWEGESIPTEGGGAESGLYLGVMGFNQALYNCPITKLDYSTKSTFESFINELSTKNGTLLYYSVDKALKTLQHAEYPDDLFSASLVTFTDGLDQGSAMMIDDYPGDEEYLDVLHNRLQYSTVAGVPFTSYSLGLKGSDVSNEELYFYNLQKLAVPSTNSNVVSSMSEVNARLQDLAKCIIQRGFSYNLQITIPGTANGTRVRFTLDNVNAADDSEMYIEGTFNLSKRSFDNVSYVGLTSSSGSTVAGVQDGIFVTFNFKDLLLEAAAFGQGYIKQWNYVSSSGSWKENSTELVTHLTREKSAVVLLNLDCSSSLSSQFSNLQYYARSFVANLCDAVGSAVTLNKSELNLITGKSETLTATVQPNNVNSSSIEWTSSNTSVATVNNGIVTGVGAGTATITASYRHNWLGGRYILDLSAQCIVNVGNSVETIALDKNSLTMYVGDSPVSLVATVLPEDAFNKTVFWSSSNTSIATVNAEGQVTAVSNGTATITATAEDGSGVNASCLVTVCTHVESVSLNTTEININKGNTYTLTATVLPTNASDKSVAWTSGDPSIATVDESGKVTAVNGGSTTITVTTKDGGKHAICEVIVNNDYVDLGLSVKWANWNVGASKPEEYGDYFAWGETSPKSNYSWSSYRWCKADANKLTKYCNNRDYGYNGYTDKLTTLLPEDDAARVNWGGKWRIPTDEEWTELRKNCTWTWTTLNGVKGRKVTSNMPGYTDKWIFFPFAGYRSGSNLYGVNSGYYCSSYFATNNPSMASGMFIDAGNAYILGSSRKEGVSVRPVSK